MPCPLYRIDWAEYPAVPNLDSDKKAAEAAICQKLAEIRKRCDILSNRAATCGC
jgi:hypothetical protein